MTTPDADELALRDRLRVMIDGPGPDGAQPDTQPVAQPEAEPEPEPQPDAQPEAEVKRGGHSRIPPWFTGRHVDLVPATDEEEAEPDDDDDPDAEPYADDPDDADDPDAHPQPDAPTGAQPKAKSGMRIRPRMRIRVPGGGGRASASGGGRRALVETPVSRMSLIDAYQAVTPSIRWLVLHGSAAAAGYQFGLVAWSTHTTAWLAAHGLNNPTAYVCYAIAGGAYALHAVVERTKLPLRWLGAIPASSLVLGTLLYGTGWAHLNLEISL